MPPDARSYTSATVTALTDRRWDQVGAAVNFWVRTSRLSDGLDARLLDSLRRWLDEEWDLDGHVFVTNEQCEQQVELIERAGLRREFTITKPEQSGAYLAFA
jgi:hypothetical protein